MNVFGKPMAYGTNPFGFSATLTRLETAPLADAPTTPIDFRKYSNKLFSGDADPEPEKKERQKRTYKPCERLIAKLARQYAVSKDVGESPPNDDCD